MGRLKIVLLECQNLDAKDLNGLSDPYVIFTCGKVKVKSKTIKKTLNPVYNETFFMLIDPNNNLEIKGNTKNLHPFF